MRHTLALALALAGCAKHGDPDALAAIPHLPSPASGTYARVPTPSPDPAIASRTADLAVDGSLTGAAAGLSLRVINESGGLSSWEIRAAAWKAGWPYPVRRIRAWSTAIGEAPPDLDAWLAAVQPGDAIGLVRARGSGGEAWIGLVSTPRLDVGTQPRQLATGGELTLPPLTGATLTVISPLGETTTSGGWTEPLHVPMATTGEWFVEIRDAQGVAAAFPVYVKMPPPEIEVLRLDDADAPAAERAVALLDQIRDFYAQPHWRRDPLLDAAARALLDSPDADGDALVARMGLRPDQSWHWTCHGSNVEECLDQLIWSADTRPALLLPTTLLGLEVRPRVDGVDIAAVIGSE